MKRNRQHTDFTAGARIARDMLDLGIAAQIAALEASAHWMKEASAFAARRTSRNCHALSRLCGATTPAEIVDAHLDELRDFSRDCVEESGRLMEVSLKPADLPFRDAEIPALPD